VLDTGVFIGMDRYGLELYLPYDRRQATVLALLERGYAERMFLAADSCATIDWFPADVLQQLLAAGAAVDWDIRNVPEKALPRLREAGMTAEQERTMMVSNPVRWLTGESP
jgi:phosphotriesterase-related protein